MHHLLERQLKKVFGGAESFSPEWEAFLQTASGTYESYDEDRKLLEHSFDVSSKEFLELQNKVFQLLAELKAEKEGIERKVVERTQELTLANNRLLELDKVKTEFISVAAHQLRTPLSAVKWALSLLIDEEAKNLTAEQRTLLLKGYESNERTINLINKMLVVTRIESGKMAFELTDVHIENIIDATMLDFAGYVETHHIKLTFARPKKTLPHIHADADKLRSVLQNLIENAVYYTKDGGAIGITAELADGRIKVSVKDSGIGIPPKQHLGIFNKFFRADNAAKIRTDGSGLGLFVAKNIVDRHGGEIGFTSVENVGSTFYFTVPVGVAKEGA
jgi:signal transduction histidine kinase